MTAGGRQVSIAVGAASRPIQGEFVSGDAHAVVPWAKGAVVAVVDGLGHGPKAAAASAVVLAALRKHADLPMEAMFFEMHRAALGSRGAVGAVARIDEHTSTVHIAGLGNIGVVVARKTTGRSIQAPLVPGVLGSSYREVRPQTFLLGRGDRVLLYSDGIRSRVDLQELAHLSPQEAADSLLASRAKPTDDALCVVFEAVAPRPAAAASLLPASATAETIPVRIPGDPEAASVAARRLAEANGFSVRAQWEIGIAVSELATNILKYGETGEIRLRFEDAPLPRLLVYARDWGPGIVAPEEALRDGWSRGADQPPESLGGGKGLGVGLGSVRRMMDEVSVTSAPDEGTRVMAVKVRR